MFKPEPALAVDVISCDREPIHIPGSIQPHGYLLAFEPATLTLRMASANVTMLVGRSVESAIGCTLRELFGKNLAESVERRLDEVKLESRAVYLRKMAFVVDGADREFNVIGHRCDGLLVLELEPSGEADASFNTLHPLVESFLARLGTSASVRELAALAAEETRRITGFDRVLIYQFDAEWNGTVIAENRNDRLPSYDDLRFPASDIPRQARELYRINRLRIIPDAGYTPTQIIPTDNPLTGRPIDLSLSVLRSVSPVHVEYMKNMGTASSMSISIIREGQLWGLISCHHRDPKQVTFDVRMACDFLGQVFSLQLTAKENHAQYEYRVRLKTVLSQLLARMTSEDNFVSGLLAAPEDLLQLTGAQGAAVVVEDKCFPIGVAPSVAQIQALVAWLAEHERREVFSTESLSHFYPPAEAFKDVASGLLGIAISKVHNSFILWFRPEVVQTVKWSGDPRKPTEAEAGDVRIHPRTSFNLWKETVRDRALAWEAPELEIATEFRNVIIGIVLKKAEELAGLTRDLERSNKELEAFSYSVSHDLRAPFRHIVGYGQLLQERKTQQLDAEAKRYIGVMIDSAQYAGKLVDNLLSFSQMGRATLSVGPVDMDALFAEVKRDVVSEAGNRKIIWKIGKVPPTKADLMMLKLAVRNLLSNAIKYTGSRDEAVIEIGADDKGDEVIYFVRDNGVGFDMAYENKLFGVFQRLHAVEEFEGTGIGLANVRRIISRHGGRTWAKGVVNEGATFYFSLPREPVSEGHQVQ